MGKMQYNKQLNTDEYVDMAIRNVLEVSSKAFEKDSFDLNDVKNMKMLLINELENICIGSSLINKKKHRFDASNMDEHDKDLLEAATKYFANKYGHQGAIAINYAKSFLKANIEGDYDTKVRVAKEQIDSKGKEEGRSQEFCDLQLSNYKLQLILSEIQRRKPKSVELGVDY
jgi:hypothetical protein